MTKFKWVVEFEVSENWVADGFEMTAERAKDMIESALPYSYPHETAVKIVAAPDKEAVKVAQGY